MFFSDERKFAKIYDINQDKVIFKKEFGIKEMVIGATVIKKTNLIVFGSKTGIVRLIDCSKFEDIKDDMEIISLPSQESGINLIKSSLLPK